MDSSIEIRAIRQILASGVNTQAWPGSVGDYQIDQSPFELAKLCQFIVDAEVKTYLEVGLGYGGTWTLLTDIFKFRVSCGISHYRQEPWHQPENGIALFDDSQSEAALEFALYHGPFDFIFIDATHDHEVVLQDWRRYAPLGRYIGFHDIAGLYGCTGSQTSWEVIKASAEVLATIIDVYWPTGIGVVRGTA